MDLRGRTLPAIILWALVASVAYFVMRGRDEPPIVRFALFRTSTAQFYVDGGAVIGDSLNLVRTATETVPFGAPGDVGLVCPQADRDDPRGYRVFASGRWFMFGHGRRPQQGDFVLGQPGDLPLCADFDGDGLSDSGVFRDGMWVVATRRRSPNIQFFFGDPGDRPVALNVRGAGNATDRRNLVYGVYRRGMWYLDIHGTGRVEAAHVLGGLPQDVPLLIPRWSRDDSPTPGYSLAIFRDGVWYLKPDPDGAQMLSFSFGGAGDLPGFTR